MNQIYSPFVSTQTNLDLAGVNGEMIWGEAKRISWRWILRNYADDFIELSTSPPIRIACAYLRLGEPRTKSQQPLAGLLVCIQ